MFKVNLCLSVVVFIHGSVASVCPVVAATGEETSLTAVVKVHSKNRPVSLSSPWRKQTPRSVSGSGVIIGKGRVLTNAHVIMNTTEIMLQPAGSSKRIPARLKSFATGIDLAILEFDPREGLEDIEPLKLAEELPAVQSTVRVYGYPTGGDAQSVTEGIISRIEHTSYRYGARGLRIQIDAAINPGNSGGPAMVEGRIAGLAFSSRRNANDIGYVIPTVEIQKFLDDVKDGSYGGKPAFNVQYQYLENPVLRRQLNVPDGATGVLCRGVSQLPDSPLKNGDVITHISKYSVDNRGKCRMDNDVNLTLSRLAGEIATDGHVPVTVIRDGTEQQLSVPVETRRKLIDYLAGNSPTYFVYGPLVFSNAKADYLAAIDAGSTSTDARQRQALTVIRTLMQQAGSPLLERRNEYRNADSTEELVVVTRLLTHTSARGYRPIPYFMTVKSVDGQTVTGFAQLVTLLRDAHDEFVEIRFHDSVADIIVLDRQQTLDATESILEDNGIIRQGSRELMKIWELRK